MVFHQHTADSRGYGAPERVVENRKVVINYDCNQTGATRREGSSGAVSAVAELVYGLHYGCGSIDVYALIAIEHTRNRGFRHSGRFRNR
jgi:hypothetical protein